MRTMLALARRVRSGGAGRMRLAAATLLGGALGLAGCASSSSGAAAGGPAAASPAASPGSDPRVGLGAGLLDAEEAIWNLRKLASVPPPRDFVGVTNSDLAFKDNYVFQGNYNGFQIWDISDRANPQLVTGFVCPASQSDVSVYQNLLFVSGEGLSGRLDCGTQGVEAAASPDRLRGLRIFDISDIRNPVNVGNVQTCRGSHTHTVVVDPDDPENVYIYISGSSVVRPAEELPGCSDAPPEEDPNTALFRIEVIKVPLANPGAAAIVSSPRIFSGLVAPPSHGLAPEEQAELEAAQARGEWVVAVGEQLMEVPPQALSQMLAGIVAARGGTGEPTAADSATLRARLPAMIQQMIEAQRGPGSGPTQCHDITVYPAIGLAGGACEGYGLLIDISNPVEPVRITAVADSNFSYWHSATFNNDGTKVLFTDEWGGGGAPKCRASDPKEWGADAIFTIENRELKFQSYYKLPAPQTVQENCVAHNGSLIPIPGRDVMVQAWYQGGISVFDWTDPQNPVEIAYHDRGPIDPQRMRMGGSWSVYWYNGAIVSSEIARGLDIFELVPSEYLTQNEIDAANTVRLEYLNAQGQPQYVWPPSFALARAYLDQLERNDGLAASRIETARQELVRAESTGGQARQSALTALADRLEQDAGGARDAAKVRLVAKAVRDLVGAS
ncbi:MAG TPA: hypothetical protein VF167_07240 [Longimicrobiaceae bacterium]